MKKISILGCVSDSIKYLLENIRSISFLVLQVYAATIVSHFILFKLIPVHIFVAGIVNTLIFFLLGTSFTVSVSRHILLREPFNISLPNLMLQQRYWYCMWATLKWWLATYFVSILFEIIFIILLLLIIFVFGILIYFLPAETLLSYFTDNMDLIMTALGIFSSIFLIFLFIVFAIGFIYISLFAAIDKKAKLRESWKLTKGNRTRIGAVLFLVYLIISIPPTVIMLPTWYSRMGWILNPTSTSPDLALMSTNIQVFSWESWISTLIALFLSPLLAASIALSYQSLSDKIKGK